VQLIDADGDGRADLLVAFGALPGYFPMTFAGGWSRRSFQPYRQVPSTSVDGPNVRLIDLDGDGLTVVRSGSQLECFFNDADPRRARQRTTVADGPVSGIDLTDPTIRLADMTGDGLTDIVHLRNHISELALAAHEDTAAACGRARSIAHLPGTAGRIGHRPSADEVVRPMRQRAPMPIINANRRTRGGQR
jgi:hypothetical protein